jgi:hypothetical protein
VSFPLSAARHHYVLNTVSCSFLHLTDTSLTILLYVQHEDDPYNRSPPTPLFSCHRARLLSGDSNVFKQPPRSSRMASSITMWSSFPPLLLSRVLSSSRQTRRPGTCARGTAVQNEPFVTRFLHISSSRRSHLCNCCPKTAPYPTVCTVFILLSLA